jgi:hypothetical protein
MKMRIRYRTERNSSVRLSACVQASRVQTMPRSAHIDVKCGDHGNSKVALTRVLSIAAKARTRRRAAKRTWKAHDPVIDLLFRSLTVCSNVAAGLCILIRLSSASRRCGALLTSVTLSSPNREAAASQKKTLVNTSFNIRAAK